jgi:hypothetical protein
MSARLLARVATGAIAVAVAGTLAGSAAAAPSRSQSPHARPGWRIVTTIGSASTGELSGSPVVATSAGNAFAYWQCSSCSVANRDRNFITHWNGRSWQRIALPAPLNYPRSLISIGASSASNLWVITSAGRAGIWNGSKWSLRSIPRWALAREQNGDLGAEISVAGPGNAWIFTSRALAAHFFRGAWHKVHLPAVFSGGTVLRPNDIWSLAITKKSFPAGKPVFTTMHWNGSAWHTLALPAVQTPSGLIPIYILAATGPRSVWVSRTTFSQHRSSAALLHWTGRWHTIKPPAGTSFLSEPASDGSGGVWAVGSHGSGRKPVISFYHYAGGHWSHRAIPAKPGLSNLVDVLTSIPGTRSLWASGQLNNQNGSIEIGAIMKFGP